MMCDNDRLSWTAILVACFLLILSAPAFAQSSDSEESDSLDVDAEVFEPMGPTSAYDEPTKQFLSIHGYASGIFAASFEDEFTSSGEANQAFLPGMQGDSKAGFGFDGTFSPGLAIPEGAARLQIQFVQGSPTMMQLYARWHILESLDDPPSRAKLRLTAGRFWWPFGNHNSEWFSIKNDFNLQTPVATQVVPPHHSPIGAKLDGAVALTEELGLNYTLGTSAGPRFLAAGEQGGPVRNTMPKVNIEEQPAVTGRVVGVMKEKFRLGFSISHGRLRAASMDVEDPDDVRNYPATYLAYGPHARVGVGDLTARLNYYRSEENLEETDESAENMSLQNWGATADVLYQLPFDLPAIGHLSPKVRFSVAESDNADGTDQTMYQYGGGMNFHPAEPVLLKAEYLLQQEEGALDETPNNLFTASVSVQY